MSSVTLFATLATPLALAEEESHSRWGLGLGSVVSTDPYAGRGTRFVPVPLLSYEGERFFFRGISGGAHLFDSDLFELDFVVKGDFDGMDADDFGWRELARNGIDRDLLDDRDDTVQAGFQLGVAGKFGELELAVTADVLDASGGFEASAEYGYPIRIGERFKLTPTVGVEWLSKDNANYYYGTLDEEVARGVVSYRPGAAAIPEVGLGLEYAFRNKWMLMGNVSYKFLPSRLADSPLLDSDRSARLMIGVVRAF